MLVYVWSNTTHLHANTFMCVLCRWCIINSAQSHSLYCILQLNTRVIWLQLFSVVNRANVCILFVLWISFSLLSGNCLVYSVQYIRREITGLRVCCTMQCLTTLLCAINFVIHFFIPYLSLSALTLGRSPLPPFFVSFIAAPSIVSIAFLLHFGQRHQPSLHSNNDFGHFMDVNGVKCIVIFFRSARADHIFSQLYDHFLEARMRFSFHSLPSDTGAKTLLRLH